ncbi:hypothetical protein AX17_007152 [Amanita inopinata Kibby_2008]|nr:hypothetical protein AX17_007152 [Amanita inopinata Kibby_2008]
MQHRTVARASCIPLFYVAFYSIWVLFTHPRPAPTPPGEKLRLVAARIDEYPGLLIRSVRTFWTACVVFGPLLWSEIRWWSPQDSATRSKMVAGAVLSLGLAVMGAYVGWCWIMRYGVIG